jgi:hypothetical protein
MRFIGFRDLHGATRHFLSILLLAATLAIGMSNVRAEENENPSFLDESQQWSSVSLKLLNHKPWSLTTYAETRFADEDNPQRLWLVSEKLGYAALRNLAFGANYTFLHYRVPAVSPAGEELEEPWIAQHRLELEANPNWQTDWIKISLRNRFEIRWTEKATEENYRSRHRLDVSFPLSSFGPLESLLVSDELFYDYSAGEFNENRFIPLGMDWRLAKGLSMRVYYMERSVKSKVEWTTTHVFGTMLLVTF